MNRSSLLERILTVIVSVFDAYSAVLFLAGVKPDTFHIASYFSLGDRVNEEVAIRPGQGLVGWILRNRQPLLINSFNQKRSILGYYTGKEELKIKAFMGCSLSDDQKGALCLDSKRTHSFSEKDQKILQLFAGLIGEVCRQSVYVDESRRASAFFWSLDKFFFMHHSHTRWSDYLQGFLTSVAKATGFSFSFLLARDQSKMVYTLEGCNQQFIGNRAEQPEFSIGSGLAGWVFRNNQPVYIGKEDVVIADISPLFGFPVTTPIFKSLICLPLTVHKQARGVLGLASETPIELTEEIRSYTRMAGEHLALFLENLYLRSRLRK